MKVLTIRAFADVYGLPLHDLVDAALVSIDMHAERMGPQLHLVPSQASLQEEAQALRLRAIQQYGHRGRWTVWMPGNEDHCTDTTVDHCTCDRFQQTGSCPCVALVCELESTSKGRAA